MLWFVVMSNALQWKQLATSDLPSGPIGRTSPSNVLYHDSIIMYGGAVCFFYNIDANE